MRASSVTNVSAQTSSISFSLEATFPLWLARQTSTSIAFGSRRLLWPLRDTLFWLGRTTQGPNLKS